MQEQIRKERLYSGIYTCMDCNTQYEITRAKKQELICDECEGDLVWMDEYEDDRDYEEE